MYIFYENGRLSELLEKLPETVELRGPIAGFGLDGRYVIERAEAYAFVDPIDMSEWFEDPDVDCSDLARFKSPCCVELHSPDCEFERVLLMHVVDCNSLVIDDGSGFRGSGADVAELLSTADMRLEINRRCFPQDEH